MCAALFTILFFGNTYRDNGDEIMIVKRYLNGQSIEQTDLSSIVIDSESILRIIADVNRRLKINRILKQNGDGQNDEIYRDVCVI